MEGAVCASEFVACSWTFFGWEVIYNVLKQML